MRTLVGRERSDLGIFLVGNLDWYLYPTLKEVLAISKMKAGDS